MFQEILPNPIPPGNVSGNFALSYTTTYPFMVHAMRDSNSKKINVRKGNAAFFAVIVGAWESLSSICIATTLTLTIDGSVLYYVRWLAIPSASPHK